MTSSDPKKDIYRNIAAFWSSQLNNEVYLHGYPDVDRGSKEYFDIILAARRKYIYYLPQVFDFLDLLPGKDLLEVGCGMGTDALLFAKRGYRVTGVDLATEHLKLAQVLFDLHRLPCDLVEGSAEQLPFPDSSFDGVYSFGVLHHTPNTRGAIEEIWRILKPSGRAVLMLYHSLSLNNFAHWLTRRGFENPREDVPGDAPVTQRFTTRQVREMCHPFSRCTIRVEYLYGAGWRRVYDWTPKALYRCLSKVFGWHLVVYLEK